MKEFVSTQCVRLVTLGVSASLAWAVFILSGYPLTGLVCVSLAFSAALWASRASTRSMRQIIRDIDAEMLLAAAPVAVPSSALKGKGPR